MKHKLLLLCMIVLLVLSCNLPNMATPAASPTETLAPVATSTFDTGGTVSLNNVSFTLPLGVAADALSEMVPATTEADSDPWSVAPAHLKFQLTGYQLNGTFFEPQVLVYPAGEYANVYESAAGQIQRLKDVLNGGTLSKDTVPTVPFFNAAQLLASQIQLVDFQNGRGVRMLAQYAQYPAPINNHELFYLFQGLTQDGSYYVIAILPVTASILQEDDKPESPIPAGGVPIPQATGPDPAYYDAITKALDAMYPDSFNPSLFQLDALIQSIQITP